MAFCCKVDLKKKKKKTWSLFIFSLRDNKHIQHLKKARKKKKNVYFGCAKQPGAIMLQVPSAVCSAVSSAMLTITSVLWPGSWGSTESIFSARLSPWWPTAPGRKDPKIVRYLTRRRRKKKKKHQTKPHTRNWEQNNHHTFWGEGHR